MTVISWDNMVCNPLNEKNIKKGTPFDGVPCIPRV